MLVPLHLRQAPQGPLLAQVVIAGPTASGKSDLAVALAQDISGEVVSADSRQVYRELDAGTAKPRRDESGRVEEIPYHMIDVADPAERYDAGRYASEARPLLAEIRARGRVPILAGGTGLYLRALLQGLAPLPKADPELRRRLELEAEKSGRPALHARLAAVDPEAAARVPAGNLQRVVRALEVHALTGLPISEHWRRARPAEEPVRAFVIDWPAQALRERIAARARAMWPAMLEEVERLVRRYDGSEPGFESLGYPEALACVRRRLSEEEGLAALVSKTLAYAKRQRTWFRHQLAATAVPGGPTAEMLAFVRERLR